MRTKYVARVLAVLSTALLLLGLIAIPASADAATGSMTGPVYGHLDPQTNTFPRLSGVVVTVVPANDENAPPAATATTDATGWYRIDGIPPGDYKVHFAGNPDLYRPGWFGGVDSFATATAVTIYAGVLRDGVGTYLQDATTSIVGWVSGSYDAQSQTTPPVVGATVNLIPAVNENANPVKVATTAADGSFSMTAIPPGQYKVRATANDPLLGAPRWYGGASFAEAAIVTITPGTHLLWVYVLFDTTTTASISGTVRGPFNSGTVVSGGTVAVVPADDENADPVATAITAADGTYVIRAVPPGRYKLLMAGDPTRYFPQWYGPIDGSFVNAYAFTIRAGIDNSNIDVYLRDATISVSGWVGGYDVNRLPGVTVELVPADSDTQVPVAAATTGADGTYTVTGIAPGEYKVYFRADPLRYVSEWWRGGESLTLDLGDRPGEVIAYLTDATSSFAGVVRDTGGSPLAGVTVDIFLGDDLLTPTATRTTGADGSYRFEWLAEGSYRLRYSAGPSYSVQWYPEASDPSDAWAIGMRPSFHVDDLDVVMLGTLSAPTPKITGTVKVGSKLTATEGSWGPSPVTLTYQWKANNVNISGATANSYTLPGTMYGKRISVTVTGSRPGYLPLSRTSVQTAAVAVGMLTAPIPKITGTVKVGSKLTASAGSWGPSPVTLKYQWKANNVNISGATATTYTVPATMYGKRISVTVSGTKAVYAPRSMTSALTAAVAAGTLTAPTPKITGTVKVGSRLTATAGAWGPSPVTLKYQWKVNNVNISGATATTYTLPATRKGKRITVTVTGSKTGYASAAKTSAASVPVAPGTLVAATPKITGTVKVGYRLTATAGSWGPSPVTLKYQWKAGNVNISGATATTYTPPATRKGNRITVTVTGTKTGFTSLARTSAATAPVK